MPYGVEVITYALRIKVNEHVLIKCKLSKRPLKKAPIPFSITVGNCILIPLQQYLIFLIDTVIPIFKQ
jgi:hypothetical protein